MMAWSFWGGRILAIIGQMPSFHSWESRSGICPCFHSGLMIGLGVLLFLLLPGLYSWTSSSWERSKENQSGNEAALSGVVYLMWIGTSYLCSHVLLPLSSQCVSGVHNTACSAFSSGEGVWDTTEGEEARRSVRWAKDFLGDASRTSEWRAAEKRVGIGAEGRLRDRAG